PVGVMAQKTARHNGAERVIAVDPLEYRLQKARAVNKVDTLNSEDDDLIDKIYAMTQGRGAYVAIDAVGMEANRTFLEKAKAVLNVEKRTAKVLELSAEVARRTGTI